MGVFPGRVTKSPGKLAEEALPTRRPVQFICRSSFRRRARGHFRRKNKLGDDAKVALRADFWSAAGPVLTRSQLRWGNNSGYAAVVATSVS